MPRDRDSDEVRRTLIGKGVRPLWVCLEGARPRLLSTLPKNQISLVRYVCREGDAKWRHASDMRDDPSFASQLSGEPQ